MKQSTDSNYNYMTSDLQTYHNTLSEKKHFVAKFPVCHFLFVYLFIYFI